MNNLKNSVQLIGNLGNDPEVQEFEKGRKLVKFSLATNEVYKNEKGEKVITTQWHRILAWGKTAESIGKYLKKGSEVVIQGKLTHGSYEDKEGNTRYYSEVVVNEFMMVNRKLATA